MSDTLPPQTARDYARRCATCRHDQWQNDLMGDCRVFGRDVYHDSVEACASYERQTDAG